MKIMVEGEKIIKAVKSLEGIEIVVEDANDAREAIDLVLRKTNILNDAGSGKMGGLNVTSFQSYETSAVNYRKIFLLDFLFEDSVPPDSRVSAIKELQDFFSRV